MVRYRNFETEKFISEEEYSKILEERTFEILDNYNYSIQDHLEEAFGNTSLDEYIDKIVRLYNNGSNSYYEIGIAFNDFIEEMIIKSKRNFLENARIEAEEELEDEYEIIYDWETEEEEEED